MVVPEGSTSCTVYDMTPSSTQKKICFVVRPNNPISEVFKSVATQYQYENFELVLKRHDQTIFLNDKQDKKLEDIPGFVTGAKNSIYLMPMGSWENNSKKKIDFDTTNSPITPDPDPLLSDDDLALGASASPTEPDVITIPPGSDLQLLGNVDAKLLFSRRTERNMSRRILPGRREFSVPKTGIHYVGLVNQAMTCYLNSLLQALFMTPEFRNALYKWKFDNVDEEKCIPYQLQKLFLNLQTSHKIAVETTDLTRSFGWDSTEAWQQHDIQELCRVMFDALECKFKGTEQENLINNLYEGKMIDYVKCLECCTEKSREDTFLDIPLPVRPFGSSVAYGSVEEALRAFVQPEILDGNNQYFCEKCNKKCDAHKGLKFKTFPYILTLHLKRFDFDYQTLHRIKLNDKVTFLQTLNLNSFINTTDVGSLSNLQNNNHGQTNGFASSTSSEQENMECLGRYDDCSITDSGAALEEDNCSGIATTASSSHHENELQEDDEGIDLVTSMDNRMHLSNEAGPYIYELFAIMIHSGSASGGHYYAYIKDFETEEWFCFNDQTVSSITQEDIQKSFGGGSFKAYYSGVYSSSTNAYMLMYRQIDPKRNEKTIKATEFPAHIEKLLQDLLHEKEQEDEKIRTSDSSFIKRKVYFYNPKLKAMKETKVYTLRCLPLENALETAHSFLDVQQFAPISRCRLVAYDPLNDEILQSLEGREKEPIGDVYSTLDSDAEFLLEYRAENEEFDKYEPGGITVKAYKVDLNNHNIDGPYMVRPLDSDTGENVKKLIGKKVGINSQDLTLVRLMHSSTVSIFKDNHKIYSRCRIFFSNDKEPSEETADILKQIVQNNFMYFTFVFLFVPSTDSEMLEKFGIPKYEPKQKIEEPTFQTPKQSPSSNNNCDALYAAMFNGVFNGDRGASGDYKTTSPFPVVGTGHESNSEDSSLSDGDRTLVESAPHDSSQVSSTSHSPQLSSPEDEIGEKIKYKRPILALDIESDEEDVDEIDDNLYFRAYELTEECYSTPTRTNGNLSDSEDNKEKVEKYRVFKIFLHKNMKIGSLKRALEPYVGVPVEYFKIVRKQSDHLKLDPITVTDCSFKEGDQIKIEFGRNLKKGECKAKIYYLKLDELNDEIGALPVICEWIFKIGLPVIDAKREIIAQLHKIDAKYHTLKLENCRLWEKGGKNPIRVLPDDHQLCSDLRLSTLNCEFIVQECLDGETTLINEDSLVLFVRRWNPSTLELSKFQEIILDKNSEITKVLSSVSDIPEDKIAYCRVNSTFPCTNISVLSINTSQSWCTAPLYSLCQSQNGYVYFYKDNSEAFKDLTTEERREINQKEMARLERIGGSSILHYSPYSPRKERALKIYLEK